MATGDNQERRIIIIGKVGTGKSAVGNAILGQKAFISKQSFCSVTKECCVKEVIRNNRRFIVCDTPGANGLLGDRDFLIHLRRCLYVTSPGFHVILFVISAGQRIEQSEVDMFKEYEKLLGDQAYTYSIIAFTHVEPDECERLIRDSKVISDLCSKCRNRFICFGNQPDIEKALVQKFEKMVENLISVNPCRFYQHEAYSKAFKIIHEDAMVLMENHRGYLSYEDSISKARQAAFEGKSPQDESLMKLIEIRRCCVIL